MSDETKKGSGRLATERQDDSQHEVVQIVKRGADFVEELLKENERLRFRLADIEAKGTGGTDESLVKELLDKVGRLEEDRLRLSERFAAVEAENKDFASRYVEIETENNNLLNIYVASYQLHSTLDFQEVLQIITEIILNFVGAEVFAIALVPEGEGTLRPLITEGIDREEILAVPVKGGIVGSVVEAGEAHFRSPGPAAGVQPDDPAICVPLKIKGQIIGVILIYRFLQQKTQLAPVDHELFTLLAGHAATAIFAARLYTDSKRKLKTIQGFIDMMTSEQAAG